MQLPDFLVYLDPNLRIGYCFNVTFIMRVRGVCECGQPAQAKTNNKESSLERLFMG